MDMGFEEYIQYGWEQIGGKPEKVPSADDIKNALLDHEIWVKSTHGQEAIKEIGRMLGAKYDLIPIESARGGWYFLENEPKGNAGKNVEEMFLDSIVTRHIEWAEDGNSDQNLMYLLLMGWKEYQEFKSTEAVDFEDARIEFSKEFRVSFVPKINDAVFAALNSPDIKAYATDDGLRISEVQKFDNDTHWAGVSKNPKSTLSVKPRLYQDVGVYGKDGLLCKADQAVIPPDCPIVIALRDTFANFDLRSSFMVDAERLSFLAMSLQRPTYVNMSYLLQYLREPPPSTSKKNLAVKWTNANRDRVDAAVDGLRYMYIRSPGGGRAWIANVEFIGDGEDGDPIYKIGRADWYQRVMDTAGQMMLGDEDKYKQAMRLSGGLFWRLTHAGKGYLFNRFYRTAEMMVSNSGRPMPAKLVGKVGRGESRDIKVVAGLHRDNANKWFRFTVEEWARACGIPWIDGVKGAGISAKSNSPTYQAINNAKKSVLKYQQLARENHWPMTIEFDANPPRPHYLNYIRFRATPEFRTANLMRKQDMMEIATLQQLLDEQPKVR